MKALIWIVAGFLGLLWTGFASLMTGLLAWASQATSSAGLAEFGRVVAQWPVPGWVSWWIDPDALKALQETVRWTLENLGGALPMAGSIVGWLVPLGWVLWGLGLLTLFALAVGMQMLVGRRAQMA